MHKSLSAIILATFVAMPCLSHAELVLDSQLPGKTLWWFGSVTSQDEGNAFKLGGTARKLDSVTINWFYHEAGVFDITASIYAMPPTIANDDVLTNPLWSMTVQKTYSSMAWDDITFSGSSFVLPDELALVFSFKAISGVGGFMMHVYNAYDNPPIVPAIGSLNSNAYYTGITDVPTGWWNPGPDEVGTMFVTGKINASAVPEPFTLGLFATASLAAVWKKRRR